ncbi:MAG: T9SS type A sorting domain-containing protein [Calditrichia bacterium]
MNKQFTALLAAVFIVSMSGLLVAQNVPIDFEPGGYGAAWTWNVFEDDTNPPLEIIANPDPSGINTSATVAKFTALQAGQPWAGCETAHGGGIGTFTLDTTNSIVKIMVWKPVISDVGIKFAKPDGSALPEIKVANTVINQWEELSFDFSSRIGDPITIDQDQIIIFPDFDLTGRTQDNICYFDNITLSAASASVGPAVPAPTPTLPASDVISIFSDAYTDIPGTDLNPNWGQATVVTQPLIQGNPTLLYAGLNYQGIQLGSNQNLTAAGMVYLHLDYWSDNSTALSVFLISPGPVEAPYALGVPTTGWMSVDIPLSAFAPVDLSDVFQLKFEGNGDIYLDNLYFSTTVNSINEVPAPVPAAYVLEQNYPNPFNPVTQIRFSIPAASQVTIKVFNLLGEEVATLLNEHKTAGTYDVSFDATSLPSGVYVYSISAGSFTTVRKMVLMK